METATDNQKLAEAVDAGSVEEVYALIAHGVCPDARLAGGQTPLVRAAAKGQLGVVRALLNAGADVNARRDNGMTPLMCAALFGHAQVVAALLNAGADREAADHTGSTALGWATLKGHVEIVRLLKGDSLKTPEPSLGDEGGVSQRVSRALAASGGALVPFTYATPQVAERSEGAAHEDAGDKREGAGYKEPPARRATRRRLRPWHYATAACLIVIAVAGFVYPVYSGSESINAQDTPAPFTQDAQAQAVEPLPVVTAQPEQNVAQENTATDLTADAPTATAPDQAAVSTTDVSPEPVALSGAAVRPTVKRSARRRGVPAVTGFAEDARAETQPYVLQEAPTTSTTSRPVESSVQTVVTPREVAAPPTTRAERPATSVTTPPQQPKSKVINWP